MNAQDEQDSAVAPTGGAETARRWCGLIRHNRHRFTPRAEILSAALRYLPMTEVVALTGLTTEEIEAYIEGAN